MSVRVESHLLIHTHIVDYTLRTENKEADEEQVAGLMECQKLQPRWFGPYRIAAYENAIGLRGSGMSRGKAVMVKFTVCMVLVCGFLQTLEIVPREILAHASVEITRSRRSPRHGHACRGHSELTGRVNLR